MAARGKQWGDTKAQGFGNEPWDKKVEWFTFPSGEEQSIRLVGKVYVVARHWATMLNKSVPGQKPKVYPQWCTKFDSITEELNPDRVCPLCDDFDKNLEKLAVSDVIVRKFQQGKSRRSNPVVPVMWRYSDVEKVFKKAVEKFKADPADQDKGCDFEIEYDPNNKKNRWTIQRGEQTPLSEEECQYPLTDFEALIPDYEDPDLMAEDARAMKKSLARSGYFVISLRNGEEGWAGYKTDVTGKPYTNYPDLVALTDSKDGKPMGGGHSSRGGDDDMPVRRASRQDPDEDQPPARQARRQEVQEEAPPPRRKAPVEEPSDADEAPVAKAPVKPAAKAPVRAEPEDLESTPVVQARRPAPKLLIEEPEVEASSDEDEEAEEAEEAPVAPVKAKPVAAAAPKGAAAPNKHEVWTSKFGIIWNNQDGKLVPNCFSQYQGTKKCTSCPEMNACIDKTEG